MSEKIKIIECPRDAMQGIKAFIPTKQKINYINKLLKVGFDTIDFGSFVSPKVIPQMRDTEEVIANLELSKLNSKLLAIVANLRGAKMACKFKDIDYLGYPFSISENFQMRNTGKTISESIEVLKQILELSSANDKKVVVYLSMSFGNPYGDPWSIDIVAQWTQKLVKMGVTIISLSDTIGSSTRSDIEYLFSHLIPEFLSIEFGAHLHTSPDKWFEKVDAAYLAGCRRFDGAIKGFGGCPMAKDELVGNMPTEKLYSYMTKQKAQTGINPLRLENSYNQTLKIFGL